MCFSFKKGEVSMSVKERMETIMDHSGLSTNYKGLHRAVLDICEQSGVSEEDVPVIVVFTDGEFDTMDTELNSHEYTGSGYFKDTGSCVQKWHTMHSEIERMWVSRGYKKIPTIVYWNLNSEANGVQTKAEYPGVQFLQGRSSNMIKYILYGETFEETTKIVDGVEVKVSSITPYETFRKVMDQDYYASLEEILKKSNEKELVYYS